MTYDYKKHNLLLILTLLLMGSSVWGQHQLTLDDALQKALQKSPDIQRSQYNLDRNRESLNAEHSRLKSNLSLNVTPLSFRRDRSFDDRFAAWYTNENFSSRGTFQIRQPIVPTDGELVLANQLSWQNQETDFLNETNTNKAFSNNLYLSYTQPLFTYNRTKMALRELELALENAQLNHSVQQLNIERSVTQAFYDVFREQESLQIAIDEYNNQQKNLDIVRSKVESGLVAREELYQAELNMANSQSSLENQRVLLENARDDFKILLGIDLYETVEVEAQIISTYPDIDLQFAVDQGMKARQELRQAEINLIYAENDMIRTKATNEFRGDLSLSVGIFGDDEQFPQMYDSPTTNPRAEVTFAIPLFDWGEKKSRIKASEASLNTEHLNITDQKNTIQLGIIKVHRNLQNLENQIAIQEISVENAQRTYDLNFERYSNGDITGLDLNQYQAQLSQAKIDLINARINYKLELLNLKIQSLWDFEANQSVVPEIIQNN